MSYHSRIYRAVLNSIGKGSISRQELVRAVCADITGIDTESNGEVGADTRLRARVGTVINEMTDNGVITTVDGLYRAATPRLVALRAEQLEPRIIELLRDGPMAKKDIRTALVKHFGTDKTPSLKDDNTLYTLNGQVLKRLVRLGVLEICDGKYALSDNSASRVDDISAMLTLKAKFIVRIHSCGGEFFEHYIMTLLEKYLAKFGKTVTSNRVLGGSDDGGIDGIITTVDPLGFKETIMVQAKNRIEQISETTVRGFYGAVCAADGSRGIFATTSSFHASAGAFLDAIDNCVGVDGDKIFMMASECSYGLIKRQGCMEIDERVFSARRKGK